MIFIKVNVFNNLRNRKEETHYIKVPLLCYKNKKYNISTKLNNYHIVTTHCLNLVRINYIQ